MKTLWCHLLVKLASRLSCFPFEILFCLYERALQDEHLSNCSSYSVSKKLCLNNWPLSLLFFSLTYPASSAFLSGKSFSMYKVTRVSSISCGRLAYFPGKVLDANNFVHAKRLAGKERSASRVSLTRYFRLIFFSKTKYKPAGKNTE